MRIEKINDKQIRCTLNQKDLSDRQIKLSELAYGTDKAKALFHDMMQQAACEFGFEADNAPLMIEAIPVSSENLVLIITKVDDPEELDTRFSEFSPNPSSIDEDFPFPDQDAEDYDMADEYDYIDDDDIIDADEDDDIIPNDSENESTQESQKLIEEFSKTLSKEKENPVKTRFIQAFEFQTLEDITCLTNHLPSSIRKCKSFLYKNEKKKVYYLFLNSTKLSEQEFKDLCFLINDFGQPYPTSFATLSFFEEHYQCLMKNQALQKLAKI